MLDGENDERGINRIIEEIRALTDTISENLNDVTLFFRQAQNISKKLLEINHEEDGNQINDNLKELSSKIAGILDSISIHNEKIETVLIENSKLSLNLSSEIKSSVEQVKYYDFFEKIMLEIVTQLNSIYAKLDNNTLNVLRINKAENLKSLEDRYTMETERIVHRQALNDETTELNDGITPDINDDDNDVEFF